MRIQEMEPSSRTVNFHTIPGCPATVNPPMEKGRVEISISISPSLAIDRMLEDASRSQYRDAERTIHRDVGPTGFRLAVESKGSSAKIIAVGQKLSDCEAIVHTHLVRGRTLTCFRFRYSIEQGPHGAVLVEEREAATSVLPSGRRFMGLGYRFNPFRGVSSRRIRLDREAHLRDVLRPRLPPPTG